MGTLRLVLALMVVLSHAGVRILQLNPGVTAVVGFYLISGYVMAGLINRHYLDRSRIPFFYLDRVLRLFPQYLVYAGLTLAWYLWTRTPTTFLTRDPTALDLFNNLTVIPLNFYMYNHSDAFTLIPPGWSLGAELQFYLLAPFIMIWPRVGMALVALSLGVHVLALHGKLNTDWYGYRLLPGILWAFGLGMLLYHWYRLRPKWAAVLAWGAPVAALAIYAYLRHRGLHAQPYHQEVLVGWGLGLPLVHLLARRRAGRLDGLAGDMSYGVFLNHFLLIWLFFPGPERSPWQLAALCAASMLLSFATQRWIERPVLARRRQLRAKPQGNSGV